MLAQPFDHTSGVSHEPARISLRTACFRDVSSRLTTPGVPQTQSSDTSYTQDRGAQLGSVQKQIPHTQAELRHMKAEIAQRDQRTEGGPVGAVSALHAAGHPTDADLPQIPAGYALVPASPGSAAGSVVVARAEPPPPKPPAAQARAASGPWTSSSAASSRSGPGLSFSQHGQRYRDAVQQHPVAS